MNVDPYPALQPMRQANSYTPSAFIFLLYFIIAWLLFMVIPAFKYMLKQPKGNR